MAATLLAESLTRCRPRRISQLFIRAICHPLVPARYDMASADIILHFLWPDASAYQDMRTFQVKQFIEESGETVDLYKVRHLYFLHHTPILTPSSTVQPSKYRLASRCDLCGEEKSERTAMGECGTHRLVLRRKRQRSFWHGAGGPTVPSMLLLAIDRLLKVSFRDLRRPKKASSK